MKTHRTWLLATFGAFLAVVLAGALLASIAPGNVVAAPVQQQYAPRSTTFYGPTAVTTGTTYSSAPLEVNTIDFARTTNYQTADVFMATGANSVGTTTIVAQVSPDAETWVDSTYIVPSFNSSGTLSLNTATYSATLTNASSTFLRMPVAGEFVRFKVIVAGGTVTPTIKVTLR